MRRLLCFALLAVVALAAAPLATGTATAAQRETALEQGILREVNRVRVTHGLRPLVLSRALQAAATFQSRILLEQGVFEHDSAAGGALGDRVRRFYPIGSARSWSVGENLLWSSDGIGASAAVKMWLDSPPHRRNMLDPTWREFGVAAVGTAAATGVYAPAGPVVVVTMDLGVRTSATRTTAAVSR